MITYSRHLSTDVVGIDGATVDGSIAIGGIASVPISQMQQDQEPTSDDLPAFANGVG